MRRKNDLQFYKKIQEKPRLQRVSRLIKKTLGEIFLHQNFVDNNGKNILLFIENIELSKDAKIATVSLKNISHDKKIQSNNLPDIFDKNITKIKKEFSRKIELRYTPKLRFKVESSTKSHPI
ncbi:MAG: hypothetical protein CMP32_00135 [Rickettsiales bacterium]|nr:hypothetical protein [Rickettsiales bacterium]|tara:strand:- start:343 stop:708 length:366 start_codon:yes stop_codon:yes gene_type:complete